MRNKRLLIGGVVLAALIGVGLWAARDVYAAGRVGATYVAKMTCSCLFVAKRTPESCRTDYNATDLARLTVTPDANGVAVTALGGLISGRAQFDTGYGCHPVE